MIHSEISPPPMTTVIPEGEQGDARISHITITEDDVRWYDMRSFRQPWFMRLSTGTYARLHAGGELQMTDTPMERRTNRDVLHRAHGDVLIGGLGIGMLPVTLLDPERPERLAIRSVTVIEKNPDVIALVAPHLGADPRLTIIEADVFEWKPLKGATYDVLYFDIWPGICEDNLEEMSRLHRRYARSLNRDNPQAFMTSWLHDHLKRERRRNARRFY